MRVRDEGRIEAVRRLFAEHDLGELEILDDWDGHELEALRSALSEEEFQLLCDRMQDEDDREV